MTLIIEEFLLFSKNVRCEMKVLKTFRRFMKEDSETYYTLDFESGMTKADVNYLVLQTVPLLMKMLKNGDARFVIEPVLDESEIKQ